MNNYQLNAPYEPKGDQPSAIKSLVNGVNKGEKFQPLLGATGTGKTFTIANVIAQTGRPALVLAHNKTLAATFAIKQEFIKNAIDNPIMSASGLSQITCPLAISAGASAVGVGSVINKLDNLVGMIAGIKGLKESLDNSLKTQKIS